MVVGIDVINPSPGSESEYPSVAAIAAQRGYLRELAGFFHRFLAGVRELACTNQH